MDPVTRVSQVGRSKNESGVVNVNGCKPDLYEEENEDIIYDMKITKRGLSFSYLKVEAVTLRKKCDLILVYDFLRATIIQ